LVNRPARAIDAMRVDVTLDPWLTLSALSSYTSISRRRLQDLVRDPAHPLACFQPGGRGPHLYRLSDIDVWMERWRKPGVDLPRLVDDAVKNVLERPRNPKGEPR